jgi:hypothetical protein
VDRGLQHLLAKAAYTGVAASNIGAKTCHVIGCLSVYANKPLSNDKKVKLRQMWQGKRYLIIDEYSMLSKTFLARLSRNISFGMGDQIPTYSNRSFGGLNVILCGDLHQFPPVALKRNDVLYRSINVSLDDFESQIGRAIYEEFTTVVILRQQNRVTDPEWKALLSHLRMGKATEDNVNMTKSLILSAQNSKDIDL